MYFGWKMTGAITAIGTEQDTRFTCLGCSRLHSGERYDSEDIVYYRVIVINAII